jgi:hypothetical protein
MSACAFVAFSSHLWTSLALHLHALVQRISLFGVCVSRCGQTSRTSARPSCLNPSKCSNVWEQTAKHSTLHSRDRLGVTSETRQNVPPFCAGGGRVCSLRSAPLGPMLSRACYSTGDNQGTTHERDLLFTSSHMLASLSPLSQARRSRRTRRLQYRHGAVIDVRLSGSRYACNTRCRHSTVNTRVFCCCRADKCGGHEW